MAKAADRDGGSRVKKRMMLKTQQRTYGSEEAPHETVLSIRLLLLDKRDKEQVIRYNTDS